MPFNIRLSQWKEREKKKKRQFHVQPINPALRSLSDWKKGLTIANVQSKVFYGPLLNARKWLNILFVPFVCLFISLFLAGSKFNIQHSVQWINATLKIADKKAGQLHWKVTAILWKCRKGSLGTHWMPIGCSRISSCKWFVNCCYFACCALCFCFE